MISPRNLIVLGAAGVAVIALGLWVSSRESGGPALEASAPVFPGLQSGINAVTEVRLTKADGTHATLRREAHDWRIAERDFPADSGRIRKLLLDVAALQVQERKTSDPKSYPQLGVEDVSDKPASPTKASPAKPADSEKSFGTRIDIVEPSRTRTLIVGKVAGSRSSYVRVGGTAQSLLVSPQLVPDADPRHWLDSSVIDLSESRVRQVAVHPASGPAYTVTRTSAKQTDFTVPDLPKGRELSASGAADPVASALSALSLDDVRKPPGTAAQDAAVPAAKGASGADRSEFQTFDGLHLQLTGHKEGDRHFIRIAATADTKEAQNEAQSLDTRFGGWELEIPAYKYDSLFRPIDEMLKPLPPPPAKTAKAHKGKSDPLKTHASAHTVPSSPVTEAGAASRP